MLACLDLLAPLPDATAGEVTEDLVRASGLRIERIVSNGQATPDGVWYDQDMAEWVVVLKGEAHLTIEGEASERKLHPGSAVFIPAHCRHRVDWTAPGEPTIWLAVFIAPDLQPTATGPMLQP